MTQIFSYVDYLPTIHHYELANCFRSSECRRVIVEGLLSPSFHRLMDINSDLFVTQVSISFGRHSVNRAHYKG